MWSLIRSWPLGVRRCASFLPATHCFMPRGIHEVPISLSNQVHLIAYPDIPCQCDPVIHKGSSSRIGWRAVSSHWKGGGSRSPTPLFRSSRHDSHGEGPEGGIKREVVHTATFFVSAIATAKHLRLAESLKSLSTDKNISHDRGVQERPKGCQERYTSRQFQLRVSAKNTRKSATARPRKLRCKHPGMPLAHN